MILGKSNIDVYPIGQGTLFARTFDGQKSEELVKKKIDVLDFGLELGMNFIDTGEDYEDGLSEKLISSIPKTKRQKFVIGSKFKPSNNSYKKIMISIEESLKRLNTDYIDVYQIQWPNPNIRLEESFEAFSRLIEAGKIRYFGVGNFSIKLLKEAVKLDTEKKLSTLQTEYDLFNRSIEEEILKFNEVNSISTVAYMSFGKNSYSKNELKILSTISKKYQKSIRSIVLNWIISHQNLILLTSSMSKEHTLENYNSQKFKLSIDDVNLINKNFIRKIKKIKPSEIEVLEYDESDTAHLIYTNLEDALKNIHEIRPNVEEIAEEIKFNGGLLRPIELRKNKDENYSKKKYLLVRGRMRFWAWIYVYGYDKEIECKIF